MKNFFRNILLKMIDAPRCGTPLIQMEKDDKIYKMMKGLVSDLSGKDKDLLVKYNDSITK